MSTTPAPADRIESEEVLDLLASLVQKSLVVYEEDEQGRGRYRPLETVRQYARDRQLEAGEGEAVRDRHRDWFVALAEQTAPHTQFGAQARAWLDRLEREHDNLQAALAWCLGAVDGGRRPVDSPSGSGSSTGLPARELTTNHCPLPTAVEAGLRLAGALTIFWVRRGHLVEARQWFKTLLARGADASATVRGGALMKAMLVAVLLGDNAWLASLAAEGLAPRPESGRQTARCAFA